MGKNRPENRCKVRPRNVAKFAQQIVAKFGRETVAKFGREKFGRESSAEKGLAVYELSTISSTLFHQKWRHLYKRTHQDGE